MTISLGGSDVQLLPHRAAWIPDRDCLVVADLHLGKSATFRARGIPVPEGENANDLARLAALVDATGARQLVVAGDLVHAADGLSPELLGTLRDWLETCPARVVLASGNHDQRARLAGHGLPLATHQRCTVGLITVVHRPSQARRSEPTIAGHLHPSIRLPESPRRMLQTPCFLLSDKVLTLPAFGSFTGTKAIARNPGDRVFVPLREEVREVPG